MDMSSLLASPYWRHGGVRSAEADRGGVAEPNPQGSAGPQRMLRYLPLVVLSTGLVTAVPVLLIEAFVPHDSLPAKIVAAAVAPSVPVVPSDIAPKSDS